MEERWIHREAEGNGGRREEGGRRVVGVRQRGGGRLEGHQGGGVYLGVEGRKGEEEEGRRGDEENRMCGGGGRRE
jgi:hypothetical protein